MNIFSKIISIGIYNGLVKFHTYTIETAGDSMLKMTDTMLDDKRWDSMGKILSIRMPALINKVDEFMEPVSVETIEDSEDVKDQD